MVSLVEMQNFDEMRVCQMTDQIEMISIKKVGVLSCVNVYANLTMNFYCNKSVKQKCTLK